jgi:hypothetical protein
MPLPFVRSRKFRALARASTVGVISLALLAPAAAQFWNPFNFGGPPRGQRQQQQHYNPFGGFFDRGPEQRRPVPAPQPKADFSSAPPPARRSPESIAAVTSPILVLGDGMADWLGSGLEDAFAEKPEFGIVRKHRTWAGLVRYDPRRDVEWPQIIREAIAADKPKFIVMMVGFHDRQAIRERGPATAPGRGQTQAGASDDPESQDSDSPESRAKASAAAQNAEMERAKQQPATAPSATTPEQKRAAAPAGPLEFQSDAWQAAYVQRIDAAIAALKSANVPVIWVGLPPQRNTRQSSDAVYLNELYRTRAERAGIVFVDIWDGFVDEAGRYVLQGPDFEGQIRRLRSGDGVYFTRAGARKLAHYVEREIQRSLMARQTPVTLPAPEPALLQSGRPGSTRPLAGPVIPLTASIGGGNELLGGGAARPTPAANDPLATRVLVRGEPVTAPAGRADNFVWPRSGAGATISEGEPDDLQPTPPQAPAARPSPQQTPQAPAAAAPRPKGQQQQPQPGGDGKQAAPQHRRPQAPPRASNESAPRPPLSIFGR